MNFRDHPLVSLFILFEGGLQLVPARKDYPLQSSVEGAKADIVPIEQREPTAKIHAPTGRSVN